MMCDERGDTRCLRLLDDYLYDCLPWIVVLSWSWLIRKARIMTMRNEDEEENRKGVGKFLLRHQSRWMFRRWGAGSLRGCSLVIRAWFSPVVPTFIIPTLNNSNCFPLKWWIIGFFMLPCVSIRELFSSVRLMFSGFSNFLARHPFASILYFLRLDVVITSRTTAYCSGDWPWYQ